MENDDDEMRINLLTVQIPSVLNSSNRRRDPNVDVYISLHQIFISFFQSSDDFFSVKKKTNKQCTDFISDFSLWQLYQTVKARQCNKDR